MCGLFGFSDPKHALNGSTASKLLNALACESQTRGKDATGAAYVQGFHLTIFKRPQPAQKIRFVVPDKTVHAMGHVRLATQGNAAQNYNNHPFPGRLPAQIFALAHNGVLRNEQAIRRENSLPLPSIVTDSYVAVQLLEHYGAVNMNTACRMAEQLQGSFCITILTDDNSLYLVRGNNPLVIRYYPKLGIYVYASTEAILAAACRQIFLLRRTYFQPIAISEGSVFCIHKDGRTECEDFEVTMPEWYSWLGVDRWDWLADEDGNGELAPILPDKKQIRKRVQKSPTRRELLFETACNMGYTEEDVKLLLMGGYAMDDIEDMLTDTSLFREALAEVKYESLYW